MCPKKWRDRKKNDLKFRDPDPSKKKIKKNLPHPDLEGASVDTNFGVTKFMILFIPYFNKWYG